MRYLIGVLCMVATLANAEVLELRSEPGTDEKLAAAVQKAMETYNVLLKEELGLELLKSVRIDISPSEENYHNKLYDFGYRGAERDKVARSTGGIASSDKRQIVVKLTRASQLKGSYKLVSHELTHFLQSELSDNSRRATTWVHEGMADFVGALVAQKMGAQSFEKWKLDVINSLRLADGYPMPQDLIEITNQGYKDWNDLTDKYKGRNYRMADLMMAYLYEKKGRALFGEMAGYYRCLSGTFNSENTCFSNNFGVEKAQFYPIVQAWAQQTLAQMGSVEIIASNQEAIAGEIEKTYSMAHPLAFF